MKFQQFPHAAFLKLFKRWGLLGAILLLSTALRIWRVGELPVALNRDEAALAYNAYLLQSTGQDEWQRVWPLGLQSFGDYKLVGYPAFLAGAFSLFGTHEWVVRLPSVIAGVGVVLLTYVTALEVFSWGKRQALLSAGLVALMPVFFFYSRIAFEANLALGWWLLAFWGLHRRGKAWVTWVGVAALAVSLVTYNSPFLLLPFLLVSVVFWRGFRQPKLWLAPVLAMLAVWIVIGKSLIVLSAQKSSITIFSDELLWRESVSYYQQFSGVWRTLIGNRIVFWGRLVVSAYAQTWGPYFLVERGGTHPWHQQPGFAHMFWGTWIAGLAGTVVILRPGLQYLHSLSLGRQKSKKLLGLNGRESANVLLLFWLLVSPLPSVITVDAPHATRSLFFFWCFAMSAVLGITQVWRLRMRLLPVQRKVLVLVFFLFVSWETSRYYFSYFRDFPARSAVLMEAGYGDLVRQLVHSMPGKPIAVVDTDGFTYILTAWELRLPAQQFFATVQRHLPDPIGFRYGYKVSQFRFIASPSDRLPSESRLLQWNTHRNVWEVLEF